MIWSLVRNKSLVEFQGTHVAFDPTGKRVATWGGRTENVSIWELATREKKYNFASPGGDVAFSPDGRRVVSPRGGSLVIRDAATGSEILAIQGTAGAPVFSPDGRKLACIGDRLTVRFADPTPSDPVPR